MERSRRRAQCTGAALAAALAACGAEPEPEFASAPADRVATPAGEWTRLPRFAVSPGGTLFLSYVSELRNVHGGDMATLEVARLENGAFQPIGTAAMGSDWFLNWADVPHLAAVRGDMLVASFLQRTGPEPYDYAVQLVGTDDTGATWRGPERLHDDDGPGEHGFVSLVPLDEENCAAIWLDGRNAAGMELHARVVEPDLALAPEIALDERVCDCCPTAAVLVPDGRVLVAFRDRSREEVRDISIVRWTPRVGVESVWASGDGWKIEGCPVNGPALAADGERAAVAWFTQGLGARARVRAAISRDGGASFGAPIEVAGAEAFGRVDAVFDSNGNLLVAWLAGGEPLGSWRLTRIDPRGEILDEVEITPIDAARDSGCARLARSRDEVYFAYTEPAEPPRVLVLRLGAL